MGRGHELISVVACRAPAWRNHASCNGPRTTDNGLARKLARKQSRRLFRVTLRSPANLNAIEDLVELDLDLLELAREISLVAPRLLGVTGQKHGEHGRHSQVAQVVDPRRRPVDDILIDTEAAFDLERGFLGLRIERVDRKRDPTHPGGSAGGWPTFRSLCSRRSVTDVPDTESTARSTPVPGNCDFGCDNHTTWLGATLFASKFVTIELSTHGEPGEKNPSVP